MPESARELSRIYDRRFRDSCEYRNRVWTILAGEYFQRWIDPKFSVLDLGCGYGEFINNIQAKEKWAMDLNPDAKAHLKAGVKFLEQDCSTTWPLDQGSLDTVFTSNFFEHLPDKSCLRKTVQQAYRCLKVGGQLIAMGPNIKYLNGLYWEFYDHHTILTENSLRELMETEGFVVDKVVPRFLPYTLVNGPKYPVSFVRLYLAFPWLWWIKGRQFLVMGRKVSTQ